MSSRPSAAARRRFHRDRVIATRIKQARTFSLTDPGDHARGRLDNEQWYIGCHRARCGICDPDKAWANGDRQRDAREWRRNEDRAW